MPASTSFSRRAAISGLGAAMLAAPALLRPRSARAAPSGQPFVQPALHTGRMDAGRRVFDLGIDRSAHEFLAGIETETIGINADFLGPILSAHAGDRLRMNVRNGLTEPMTLHWHGLHLPAAADGGPHQEIAPGATWSPEFALAQRAGTFWFHGHQHRKTAEHVWAGMAGVLRVTDDEEAALPLPRSHGEDDFTLILQDRRFDGDGQMPYAADMHDRMAGLQGDVMLVNGRSNPRLETDAPRIRLRLVNGSNGSFYRLHFADGHRFEQIASDGGLLAAPFALGAEAFGAQMQLMGIAGTRDVMELRPARARPAGTRPGTSAFQ